MCGIVGYVGARHAAPVLLDGLSRLEYRGYDSAGIAVVGAEGRFSLVRRKGRVAALESARALAGNCGIGHTRWATHGAPSERNAHPHRYQNVCLVHNGILENAASLKEACLARGERFSSDTDSEVAVHLIARFLQEIVRCYHRDYTIRSVTLTRHAEVFRAEGFVPVREWKEYVAMEYGKNRRP